MTYRLVIALTLLVSSAAAATIGQIDTFQNGTTQGWIAGGGPLMQNPPVPPFVQLSGGPAGANDAFLVVTSGGGNGPGSRLTTYNIFGQWADNYLTNGVSGIAMDLINLGPTTLTIRLEFENPFAGADFAVTSTGITLAAGSGWTHAVIPITASQLAPVEGTVNGALGNTTVLRILHAPGATEAVPIVGVLGVDNIAAVTVPEPATAGTAAFTLLALAAFARRRR